MTELASLISTTSDEFEAALLRSAERDVPSSPALARTAAALGVGTTVAAIAPASSAAAAVGTLTPSVTVSSTLKLLALGSMGGAFVAGGITLASVLVSPTPPASHAPAVTARSAEPSEASVLAPNAERLGESPEDSLPAASPLDAPRSPPSRVAASDGSTHAPVPLEEAEVASGRRSSLIEPVVEATGTATFALTSDVTDAPSDSAQAPRVASSINEEVASIDRARASLARGRPSDALAEMDWYRARFPRGALALEALVVRVEANMKLGRRAVAERAAAPVIASQPNSRYALRLRELLHAAASE